MRRCVASLTRRAAAWSATCPPPFTGDGAADSVATAIAATPSRRPTKPMPSPVVALTLTRSGSTAMARASPVRIASRCGASFGRSSMTVLSTCSIAKPCRSSSPAIERSRTIESAPS